MSEIKNDPPDRPAVRVLTRDQVRELLLEGRRLRQEVEARFDRMERIDPKDAATRAR